MEASTPKPVPLTGTQELAAFDCGDMALGDYLRKFALENQRNRSARTYVTLRDNRVIGYDTLAAGSIRHDEAPPRIARGLGKYPIPIILLARLAVDQAEKGKGLGKALLKDALLRATQASDIVGARAVLVHAKDLSAQAFYCKFGFTPFPDHELHLFLLMKDIKDIVQPGQTTG